MGEYDKFRGLQNLDTVRAKGVYMHSVCVRTCVCTVGGERCVQWKSRWDQWNRLQPDHKGLERHAKELKFQLEGNGKPMQDFFFFMWFNTYLQREL